MKPARFFLSCDWGTSAFRLRLVQWRPLRVKAEYETAEGVLTVARAHPAMFRRQAFLRVLQRGLAALGVKQRREIPLMLSGMATSNLGWRPMSYARTPARIDGRDFVMADERLAGRRVRFVSGLCTRDDVMRGEEVELAGLFHAPARRSLVNNSIVILTGTHAKHVHLHRGIITRFRTHPTGELFALLSRHSTLCEPVSRRFSRSAFLAGVKATMAEGLGATLFQTRARVVLDRLRPEHAADFLSGALIAAELASLPKTSRLVLAAGPVQALRYRLALRTLRPGRKFAVIAPRQVKHAVVAGHAHLLPAP